MAAEVGSAYVTILPSARGFRRALEKELDTPIRDSGQDAGKKLGDAIASEGSPAGDKFGRNFAKALIPSLDGATSAVGRFGASMTSALLPSLGQATSPPWSPPWPRPLERWRRCPVWLWRAARP
jgi:hypothetical protein